MTLLSRNSWTRKFSHPITLLSTRIESSVLGLKASLNSRSTKDLTPQSISSCVFTLAIHSLSSIRKSWLHVYWTRAASRGTLRNNSFRSWRSSAALTRFRKWRKCLKISHSPRRCRENSFNMFRTSSLVSTLIARCWHQEHGHRWTHRCASFHPSLRAALTSSKCGSSKNSPIGHWAGFMDMVRLSFSSPIQLRNINLSRTHSKLPFCVCSTRRKLLPARPSNRRHSSPMSYLSRLWRNFATQRLKS